MSAPFKRLNSARHRLSQAMPGLQAQRVAR